MEDHTQDGRIHTIERTKTFFTSDNSIPAYLMHLPTKSAGLLDVAPTS